jgi:hypothetical protein
MSKHNRYPCWWCKSKDIAADFMFDDGIPKVYHAYCYRCEASGPSAGSISAAVRLWNRGPKDAKKP